MIEVIDSTELFIHHGWLFHVWRLGDFLAFGPSYNDHTVSRPPKMAVLDRRPSLLLPPLSTLRDSTDTAPTPPHTIPGIFTLQGSHLTLQCIDLSLQSVIIARNAGRTAVIEIVESACPLSFLLRKQIAQLAEVPVHGVLAVWKIREADYPAIEGGCDPRACDTPGSGGGGGGITNHGGWVFVILF